ncbi:MAG: diphthamide biosynthesis enzyme Dph2 [Candidatus Aenigmarchaeota archaeon]|nr:diphthamide biosynthesis enzyme Dph2 [Candidatus Aenigmarchaeota archaeon]
MNQLIVMNQLIAEIKACNAKKVMLQVPEGLKKRAQEIVDAIERSGISVILSNDPTYGACDLADDEANALGCDLLVHVGHSKFYVDFKTAVPVLYYPWVFFVSLDRLDFSSIKEQRIGIVTTIQHLDILQQVAEHIKKIGKEAVIGGQILGCWTTNADKIDSQVDAYVFFGSGAFHPIALKGKPVYIADMETQTVRCMDPTCFEKLRIAWIAQARDARSFGILVSSKKGQYNLLGNAEAIKRRLEEHQRKATIIVMREISDQRLLGLGIDAFINTACPRILDDHFSKPIINACDLDLLLNDEGVV